MEYLNWSLKGLNLNPKHWLEHLSLMYLNSHKIQIVTHLELQVEPLKFQWGNVKELPMYSDIHVSGAHALMR